ncbi:MAG: biopolymer transporter ExbD [Pseudomonadota bacterium]
MALNLSASLSQPKRRLSMTPLIDVIFLLLLFFMLSSTFSKFGEIELASTQQVSGRTASAFIFVRLDGQDITVNGQETALATLAQELARLKEADATVALLALSEETNAQRFVDVYALARSIDGLSVAIVR